MSHTTTRAPSRAISSAMPRPMPRPAPVTMATLPATMPVISVSPQRIAYSLLSPHLVRHLHDHPQLRPLLVLGERVAFLARGEAALRREAELIEIDVLAWLLDAPLDPVVRFELACLRRHQPEHYGLALAHAPQRLERAGAVGVVFHEIAVHLDAVEQDVGHRVVAAAAHEGRTVVTAAQMHGNRHVGGDVRHRGIDQVGITLGEPAWVVAAPFLGLAVDGVAQHGDEHLVELQVATAGIGESAHALAVGGAQLGEELLEGGIGLLAHRGAAGAAVERRRRRNRDLRRPRRVRLDELEMLQHRVIGKAELADDARALRACLHALECDALLHHVALGAVETPEEVEVPPGAAELAVGDGLESHLLLLLDDALDLAILHRLERGRIDLALGVLFARLLQRCRTQQAADMVGAERRLGSLHVLNSHPLAVMPAQAGIQQSLRRPMALTAPKCAFGDYWIVRLRGRWHPRLGVNQAHPHTSSATSTTRRSLAHCSSSERILPSSVEAKPHCGERQSWSSAMNFAASSMRRLSSSLLSSAPLLEVTRPSTTILPLGTKRSGSKPPARALSYSMK